MFTTAPLNDKREWNNQVRQRYTVPLLILRVTLNALTCVLPLKARMIHSLIVNSHRNVIQTASRINDLTYLVDLSGWNAVKVVCS